MTYLFLVPVNLLTQFNLIMISISVFSSILFCNLFVFCFFLLICLGKFLFFVAIVAIIFFVDFCLAFSFLLLWSSVLRLYLRRVVFVYEKRNGLYIFL